MSGIEGLIKYKMKNPSLLENALTHSSYANERRGPKLESNERLEFLGDSILGMIVAEHLYKSYPDKPEGELTRMRAALVCERSLFEASQTLGLGEKIKLGKGEEAGGGRERPSIISDAFEAVLAAVYLDGGFEKAKSMVEICLLKKQGDVFEISDYKTALQELVQQERDQTLAYVLVDESGPDHDKRFKVEVRLNGAARGSGSGSSKKQAEQQAAKAAYKALEQNKT